jgi:hypothetical protein
MSGVPHTAAEGADADFLDSLASVVPHAVVGIFFTVHILVRSGSEGDPWMHVQDRSSGGYAAEPRSIAVSPGARA